MIKTTGDGWLKALNVGILTDPKHARELAKFFRQSLWRKGKKGGGSEQTNKGQSNELSHEMNLPETF